MRRRRRTIVIVVLAVVLCAAAWLVLRPRLPDPIYKDKPLSIWLGGFDPAAVEVVGGARPKAAFPAISVGSRFVPGGYVVPPPAPEWLAADEALHHFGTNAFPTIFWMLNARDPAWRLKLFELLGKQNLIRFRRTPATHWNRAAIDALKEFSEYSAGAVPTLGEVYDRNLSFQRATTGHDYPAEQMVLLIPEVLGKIGPKAQGAIPSLMRGAAYTNANVRWVALTALGNIHSEPATVVPLLINATHDPDEYVRMEAVSALAKFGRDADPAIPVMIGLLNDPQVWVKDAALKSLRGLHSRPDIVVPALAKTLNDPNLEYEAILALQEFGPDAAPAVPALVEYIKGATNMNRRMAAGILLKQLDPEAAERAGIK